MIVRAIGFCVDLPKLPPAMNCGHAFTALQNQGTNPIDRRGNFRGSSKEFTNVYREDSESWWAGIILKSRDAKTFSKVTASETSVRMTAEQLADGKIAESTYFVVNPNTGKGLMACYYGGPSFKSLEWALKKVFTQLQISLRRQVLDQAVGDDARHSAKETYKGVFSIYPLIRQGNLKSMMKDFSRVNSIELKIGTVDSTHRMLSRITDPKSVVRIEKYLLPPYYVFDDDHDEEADQIVEACTNPNVEATIIGVQNGFKDRLSSNDEKNKHIFASIEYDDLHGQFVFQQDGSASNIDNSPVISWLRSHINSHDVHQLLTTAQ